MWKKFIFIGLLFSLHAPMGAMEPDEESVQSSDIQDYLGAIARGSINGFISLYDAARHPVDNVLIPMGSFINDVRIIEACRDMGLNYDPGVDCSTEFSPAQERMGERLKGVGALVGYFVEASGPERVEMLAAMGVASFVPGTVVRGAWKMGSNQYKFGMVSSPDKFRNLKPEDLKPLAEPPIKLDEFRGLKGETVHKWVITENGKLIISKTIKEGQDEIKHADLVKGKPVVAAGELKAIDGQTQDRNLFSGHFKTYGPHLDKVVNKAFEKWGYTEFKGSFKPIDGLKELPTHAIKVPLLKVVPTPILAALAAQQQATAKEPGKVATPNQVPAKTGAPAPANPPIKNPVQAPVAPKQPGKEVIVKAPGKVAVPTTPVAKELAKTPAPPTKNPVQAPAAPKQPAKEVIAKAPGKVVVAKAPAPPAPAVKAVAPKKAASKAKGPTKAPAPAPKTPAKTKAVPKQQGAKGAKAPAPTAPAVKAVAPKKVAPKAKAPAPASKVPAKAKAIPKKQGAKGAKAPAVVIRAGAPKKVASKAKALPKALPKVNEMVAAKRKFLEIRNSLSKKEKKKIRKGRTSWVQIVAKKVQLAGPAVFRAWVEWRTPGIFSPNQEVRAAAIRKAEKKAKKLMRNAWMGKYDPDDAFYPEDAAIIAQVTAPWMMDKWLAGKGGRERDRIADIRNNPFESFESHFWQSFTQSAAPAQPNNNNNNNGGCWAGWYPNPDMPGYCRPGPNIAGPRVVRK